MSRKYCPDCGATLPDEHHEPWCFCREYQQRAEAAEASAAQLQAEVTRLNTCIAQIQADMKRILPTLQDELKEIGGCDHSVGLCVCDLLNAVETVAQHSGQYIARDAFELTAPIDWRGYEADETPLGIALDGGCDEVQK